MTQAIGLPSGPFIINDDFYFSLFWLAFFVDSCQYVSAL